MSTYILNFTNNSHIDAQNRFFSLINKLLRPFSRTPDFYEKFKTGPFTRDLSNFCDNYDLDESLHLVGDVKEAKIKPNHFELTESEFYLLFHTELDCSSIGFEEFNWQNYTLFSGYSIPEMLGNKKVNAYKLCTMKYFMDEDGSIKFKVEDPFNLLNIDAIIEYSHIVPHVTFSIDFPLVSILKESFKDISNEDIDWIIRSLENRRIDVKNVKRSVNSIAAKGVYFLELESEEQGLVAKIALNYDVVNEYFRIDTAKMTSLSNNIPILEGSLEQNSHYGIMFMKKESPKLISTLNVLDLLEKLAKYHKDMENVYTVEERKKLGIDIYDYGLNPFEKSGNILQLGINSSKESKFFEILNWVIKNNVYFNSVKFITSSEYYLKDILEGRTIHRDVRTANIFGRGADWVLGDFGNQAIGLRLSDISKLLNSHDIREVLGISSDYRHQPLDNKTQMSLLFYYLKHYHGDETLTQKQIVEIELLYYAQATTDNIRIAAAYSKKEHPAFAGLPELYLSNAKKAYGRFVELQNRLSKDSNESQLYKLFIGQYNPVNFLSQVFI